MIHVWHENRVSAETERIGRNRKSNSARKTIRSTPASHSHPPIALGRQGRSGSGATDGECTDHLQLAQTLARARHRRTSQQSEDRTTTEGNGGILPEAGRSA